MPLRRQRQMSAQMMRINELPRLLDVQLRPLQMRQKPRLSTTL
jgi:hypothetical protein